jgi:hypothetical protein
MAENHGRFEDERPDSAMGPIVHLSIGSVDDFIAVMVFSKEMRSYIAAAYAREFDFDNDIVCVFEFRHRSVFKRNFVWLL